MKLYAEQLGTLIPFADFLSEYKEDLAYNAMQALLEYEGTLSVDYKDYVVFFVDYDEDEEAVFAVSRILDNYRPVQICARVRKFTESCVFPFDSHGNIEFD